MSNPAGDREDYCRLNQYPPANITTPHTVSHFPVTLTSPMTIPGFILTYWITLGKQLPLISKTENPKKQSSTPPGRDSMGEFLGKKGVVIRQQSKREE